MRTDSNSCRFIRSLPKASRLRGTTRRLPRMEVLLVATLFASAVLGIFTQTIERGHSIELARTIAVNTLRASLATHTLHEIPGRFCAIEPAQQLRSGAQIRSLETLAESPVGCREKRAGLFESVLSSQKA